MCRVAAVDGDVAAGVQGFADEGVGFVAGAGVAAVQGAGQDGLGVAGGHPDGVGDELGLGVQLDHVRVVLGERDFRGDGPGGCLGGGQVAAGGVDGGVEPGQGLVGDHGGGAGGGLAQCVQFALPGAASAWARSFFAVLTAAAAVFFAGFGTIRPGSSGVTA